MDLRRSSLAMDEELRAKEKVSLKSVGLTIHSEAPPPPKDGWASPFCLDQSHASHMKEALDFGQVIFVYVKRKGRNGSNRLYYRVLFWRRGEVDLLQNADRTERFTFFLGSDQATSQEVCHSGEAFRRFHAIKVR